MKQGILVLLVNLAIHHAGTACEIWVNDTEGNPVGGAKVYFVYKDGTYESTMTKRSGYGRITPKVADQVVLLVGGKGIAGYIKRDFVNASDLNVRISKAEGGSVVFEDGIGSIDGLKGTLNPILDAQMRTYLYGRDLSINNGSIQPVFFKMDEMVHIMDNNKKSTDVSIAFIQHRVVLLNYSQIH